MLVGGFRRRDTMAKQTTTAARTQLLPLLITRSISLVQVSNPLGAIDVLALLEQLRNVVSARVDVPEHAIGVLAGYESRVSRHVRAPVQ